jgi:hypothetical protein
VKGVGEAGAGERVEEQESGQNHRTALAKGLGPRRMQPTLSLASMLATFLFLFFLPRFRLILRDVSALLLIPALSIVATELCRVQIANPRRFCRALGVAGP